MSSLQKLPSVARSASETLANEPGFSVASSELIDKVGEDLYEFENKARNVRPNPNLKVQKLSVSIGRSLECHLVWEMSTSASVMHSQSAPRLSVRHGDPADARGEAGDFRVQAERLRDSALQQGNRCKEDQNCRGERTFHTELHAVCNAYLTLVPALFSRAICSA